MAHYVEKRQCDRIQMTNVLALISIHYYSSSKTTVSVISNTNVLPSYSLFYNRINFSCSKPNLIVTYFSSPHIKSFTIN